MGKERENPWPEDSDYGKFWRRGYEDGFHNTFMQLMPALLNLAARPTFRTVIERLPIMNPEALRELLEKATAGPWVFAEPASGRDYWQIDNADRLVATFVGPTDQARANAQLIALAPQLASAVLELREALERDREQRKAAEDRLKELSLDVIAWWRVVFDTDWVHTKPGETPMQLAERARERIGVLTRTAGV